jgi:hypothetical protein
VRSTVGLNFQSGPGDGSKPTIVRLSEHPRFL